MISFLLIKGHGLGSFLSRFVLNLSRILATFQSVNPLIERRPVGRVRARIEKLKKEEKCTRKGEKLREIRCAACNVEFYRVVERTK